MARFFARGTEDAEFEAGRRAPVDEEVVVHASRGQGLMGIAVSLMMIGGVAYAVWRGVSAGGPHQWMAYVFGAVIGLPFAGLGIWSYRWWRKPPAIVLLAADGLIQTPDGRRPQVLPWSAIRAFEIVGGGKGRMLLIEPKDVDAEYRRLGRWRRFQLRLARRQSGGELRPIMVIGDILEIELERLAGMIAARTGARRKEE